MKVLLLDDRTWGLVRKKLEAELSCASTNAALMRAWEKRHGCRWCSAKWVRKRHIEALRLARVILLDQ